MPVLKKRLMSIAILVFFLVLLLLLGTNKYWIEKNYTYGLYQPLAGTLRLLFGWIPFSFGDIIYALAGLWILVKVIRNITLLFHRKLTGKIVLRKLSKIVLIILSAYVILLVFWGMNYNRKGIAFQLSLPHPGYDSNQLLKLQSLMVSQVNEAKQKSAGLQYPRSRKIFDEAVTAYSNARSDYPFLKYYNPSIKSSLYGTFGNYLGFTGYYNPFTGEAQVNTTVPKFLLPSITVHEMAHQIGYAKEKEANFVGFLVSSHSKDPFFQYSGYLDALMYTNTQVRQFDTLAAFNALRSLDTAVKEDLMEWRAFNIAHRSFIEPAIRWMYGNFLRINNQPKGMMSYDEVTSLIIAYYKKKDLL